MGYLFIFATVAWRVHHLPWLAYCAKILPTVVSERLLWQHRWVSLTLHSCWLVSSRRHRGFRCKLGMGVWSSFWYDSLRVWIQIGSSVWVKMQLSLLHAMQIQRWTVTGWYRIIVCHEAECIISCFSSRNLVEHDLRPLAQVHWQHSNHLLQPNSMIFTYSA